MKRDLKPLEQIACYVNLANFGCGKLCIKYQLYFFVKRGPEITEGHLNEGIEDDEIDIVFDIHAYY